jgi:hypothetical protein
MSSPEDQWLDHDAGPVVRPYALTGGRTRPSGESFDLIAVVSVVAGLPSDPPGLEPEHVQVLHRCRTPTSVADLASDLDLPLGVIRILLADLRERGLIRIQRPEANQLLVDARILQQVADGLRRLLPPARLAAVPVTVKILIAGGFGSGQTTLVSSVAKRRPPSPWTSAGSPSGMIC